MPWIGNAPVFLVFCGDAYRLERIGELREHRQDNGKLEGFFNAAIDAALVLQTFILAAEDRRSRVLPDQRHSQPCRSGCRDFGFARQGVPGWPGLCVGYPAIAGHISMRLPLEVTVHNRSLLRSSPRRSHQRL